MKVRAKFFLAKREEEREETQILLHLSRLSHHRLRQSQRGRVLLRVGEREKERRKERTAKMTSGGEK